MPNNTSFKMERGPINSKYAGEVMNRKLKEYLQPVMRKAQIQLEEYVKDWDKGKKKGAQKSKPQFGYTTNGRNIPGVAHADENGIGFAITVLDPMGRWAMVDTEGRKGGAIIESKKTRPSKNPRTPGAMVRVPMPIAEYIIKTGNPSGGRGDVVAFAYKVKQGAVEPQHYSDRVKEYIAGDKDKVRPQSIMWTAIRNGYRAAGRELTGNPNF